MRKTFGLYALLFLVLASTYSYAKFQGGYASWFLFAATSVIVLYEILTRLYAGQRLTSTRRISANKLTAGSGLEVDLEVRSQSKWPLAWLVVEDVIPHRLVIRGAENKRIFFPGFEKQIRMKYVIPNMQRGKYSLQDTILQTGDILGLYRKKAVHSRHDEVTVYPRIVPVRYWHTVNQFNAGMSYAQNRMAEDTTNVLGVRDYAPGDRLSRIHWRATARTGALKSKEFELHVTNDLMFFLNRCQKDYGAAGGPVFETAVTAAASLIRYGLERKYTVGLVSHGMEKKIFPVSRNQEQFIKILDHLAIVQPDSDLSFTDTVLKEISYLTRGSTAVLVTPVVDGEMVKLVGLLDYRKIKTEFFLIKSSSMITQAEREMIGKLALFGVHAYFVGSEQELEEAVRGPVVHAAYI
ncbi:DUF58 domain-containing protein [Effusibacillus lacus]|uniref:DUF58 domain-containing protein n=1 Tax=Effusibacillus lacus TaxID=1348429 RepID=A0A292YJU4_9BACL|nr:DUF58 domain-containing protein [Effusibacillus lacus]TCS74305.1 uncharacterized protein (DUF58 family) [Effusibacillus lacus]GAX88765.1 hypothetical protein EFBL_0379 [Effusibacillus lacus]